MKILQTPRALVRQALYDCKAPCILAAVIAAVLQQKCHEHQHRKQQQRPQQRGVDVAAHTDCTAPSDKNISVEMDVVQSSLALESACRRHTDLQREIQRTLLMDLQARRSLALACSCVIQCPNATTPGPDLGV